MPNSYSSSSTYHWSKNSNLDKIRILRFWSELSYNFVRYMFPTWICNWQPILRRSYADPTKIRSKIRKQTRQKVLIRFGQSKRKSYINCIKTNENREQTNRIAPEFGNRIRNQNIQKVHIDLTKTNENRK